MLGKNVCLLQILSQRLDSGLDSPLDDIDLVPFSEFDQRSISIHFDRSAVPLDHQLDAVFVVADARSKDLLLSSQARGRNRAVGGSDARVEVCGFIGSSAGVLVVGDKDLERDGRSSIGLGYEELESGTRTIGTEDARAVSIIDFQSCGPKLFRYFTYSPYLREDKSLADMFVKPIYTSYR